MVYIVSEAAATAIFTITRLLYDSVIGVTALILFSRLPGGSSAKFWYEQPDLVAKITSLFHPFGPTGKRGVKFTNAIAMICTLLALALNILPTLLSKLSPITTQVTNSISNSTLSRTSKIFIPTLTDINLPGLSNSSTSENATNKFLCSYVANGCLDAKSTEIARINWDIVQLKPIEFFHANSNDPNNVLVAINDSFATATTQQQSMFLAKNVFYNHPNFTNAIGQWANNNMTAFYVDTVQGDGDNDTSFTTPYNFVHADQIYPLVTPDLADMLRQGRDVGAAMPTNGSIDRAERWVAVHRTRTLSSVLWQTVNAHAGQVGSDWQEACFLCSLLGIKAGSAQATSIANSLIASSKTPTTTQTFALQSYIDNNYRLSTTLCLIQLNATTNGLAYHCLHTYSQLWSIYHEGNPYNILGSYNDMSAADLGDLGTPFPFFPPPTNITNYRTYIPIVPIFQIRSKGQCATDWNYQTQSIQDWMSDCAKNDLDQVNTTELDAIAKNIWQLSSTITVGGFLINATYFSHDMGIAIDTSVIVICMASVVLAVVGNLLLNLITSPIHRRSLYEAMRVMTPDSRDPYNVQKVLLDIAPTNTLRLVDSVFDKRVSYLKLNNRLIVTLSEDQENINDDSSTMIENENTLMNEKQLQNWSRRQLLKF